MKGLSSLPLRLLTFIILPLLALLMLVAFGGVAIHQTEMREMVVEHNLHAVRGAAASLSQQLEQHRAVLAGLAERVAAGREAEQVVAEGAGWTSELFDGGLAFYGADGELLAATPGTAAGADAARLAAGGASYVALPGPGAGPVRVLITATAGQGDVRAAGIVSFDGLGVDGVLESLHAAEHTAVLIADEAGDTVYQSGASPAGASEPPQAALRGESGADFFTAENRREVIATFAPIPAAGWTVVHEEQWQAALGPLMRFSLAAPLVLVPGLLIAAGAVWFGLQQIVRPLQRLEQRASDLAWGDYQGVEEPVGGIDEIRHLQTTLRYLAERIRAAQAGLRNYIGAITQAQEEERARLARELHDQTAQSLVAISHRVQLLKRYLPDEPEAERLLGELREMTTQAVDDLRRIIRAMRPVYLEDLGLVPALQMLVKDLDESMPGLSMAFQQEGTTRRLPSEQEMALYRVAQEALNNVWQHSQANGAELAIRYLDDGLVLSVQDNGIGFEAPQRVTDLPAAGHFGIMGMYERAALIGAEMRVRSEPGRGTTVTIRLPRPAAD